MQAIIIAAGNKTHLHTVILIGFGFARPIRNRVAVRLTHVYHLQM